MLSALTGADVVPPAATPSAVKLGEPYSQAYDPMIRAAGGTLAPWTAFSRPSPVLATAKKTVQLSFNPTAAQQTGRLAATLGVVSRTWSVSLHGPARPSKTSWGSPTRKSHGRPKHALAHAKSTVHSTSSQTAVRPKAPTEGPNQCQETMATTRSHNRLPHNQRYHLTCPHRPTTSSHS